MTTIERAALPPSRGRKPKCGTCGEAIKPDPITGTTCACVNAKREVENGWVSNKTVQIKPQWSNDLTEKEFCKECGNAAKHINKACDFCGFKDGWTGSIERTIKVNPVAVTTRFPPEGLELLMGGPFNGEYRDMRNFANDFFAIFEEKESLQVHYYERGNVFGWVWAASVYPGGIELRERYDV